MARPSAGKKRQEGDISNSLNDFSFKLHGVLTEVPPKGNLFYSPLSIATTLAMIYLGTNGQTKSEIATSMGWNNTNDTQQLFRQLLGSYNSRNKRVAVMNIASRIWIKKGMRLQPEFAANIVGTFGSKVGKNNFADDGENSRRKINQWVKKSTGNTIREFLKPGTIDAMTRLVLVNAVYFKGKWKTPFDASKTRKRKFFTNSNKVVYTKMMVAASLSADVARGMDFTAIEVPYQGKKFSMIIVLPDATTNLQKFEKTFNARTLKQMEFSRQTTKVILPKFKITSGFDLRAPLVSLKISSLFGPNCDLSAMFKNPDGIFVTQAIHKSFVEVDERGTKASAVTGIISGRTFIQTFDVNRPFLFFIKDKRTDVILFTGRFVKP